MIVKNKQTMEVCLHLNVFFFTKSSHVSNFMFCNTSCLLFVVLKRKGVPILKPQNGFALRINYSEKQICIVKRSVCKALGDI